MNVFWIGVFLTIALDYIEYWYRLSTHFVESEEDVVKVLKGYEYIKQSKWTILFMTIALSFLM